MVPINKAPGIDLTKQFRKYAKIDYQDRIDEGDWLMIFFFFVPPQI